MIEHKIGDELPLETVSRFFNSLPGEFETVVDGKPGLIVAEYDLAKCKKPGRFGFRPYDRPNGVLGPLARIDLPETQVVKLVKRAA